jgi:succinate dehydrogenase subunit D
VSKRPIEPLLWLLFSAGGMLSALLMPILVFLFGVAFPLEWITRPRHESLLTIVRHPIMRFALFGICMLSLAHWAHRFRYTLYDGLQIKHLNDLVAVLCYGGAIVGSLAAAYLMWQVP